MVFDNEITAYKNCYRHLDISQVDAVISDLEASLKDFESFKGKTCNCVRALWMWWDQGGADQP